MSRAYKNFLRHWQFLTEYVESVGDLVMSDRDARQVGEMRMVEAVFLLPSPDDLAHLSLDDREPHPYEMAFARLGLSPDQVTLEEAYWGLQEFACGHAVQQFSGKTYQGVLSNMFMGRDEIPPLELLTQASQYLVRLYQAVVSSDLCGQSFEARFVLKKDPNRPFSPE